LNHGALSRAVLATIDLDAGFVHTFVPDNPAGIDLRDFAHNIFAALSAGDADRVGTLAADAVIDFARSRGANFFISQPGIRRQDFGPEMKWGKGVPLAPERVMFSSDDLLAWRWLQESSTDEIAWLVGDVGVLSRPDIGHVIAPLAEFTDGSLRALVTDTRALLTPAYDELSFLVWTPPRSDERAVASSSL